MKIGVASTCLWNLNPLEAVEFAKAAGIYSVEFWVDHINMYKPSYTALRKSLKNSKIVSTVHSVSWDINISSFSKDVREFSIREICKSIDIACQIGATIVVVHPGKMSFNSPNKKVFLDLLVEAFSKILQYTMNKGVYICIENMENRPKELLITEEDFINFFSYFPGNDIYITMDVAHLGSYSRVKSFYTHLKDKIRHIHISDLTRRQIHTPIGQGNLPYKKIISFLYDNYNGIFNLEYFNTKNDKSDVIESIKNLRKAWTNHLD